MNKRELMTTAWEIAYLKAVELGGKASEYIAYGMKEAWFLYKGATEVKNENTDEVIAPDWFIHQNLTSNEAYAVSVGEWIIDRETEKAVHFSVATDYGYVRFWCPKSILVKRSENETYYFVSEIKSIARKARGMKENEELLAQAKAMKIKGVRKGMRSDTLRAKIAKAQHAA